MDRFYIAKNLGDTSGFSFLAVDSAEALDLFAETRGWEDYAEMAEAKGDLWIAFVA
ncbi:hypothetical protein ACOTJD_30175 [Achromobacter xylosoxidans]